jgi:hypothetical protein
MLEIRLPGPIRALFSKPVDDVVEALVIGTIVSGRVSLRLVLSLWPLSARSSLSIHWR